MGIISKKTGGAESSTVGGGNPSFVGLGQRLSVIVPCFNEVATIEEILRSVRTTVPNAQMIVVDDGSTDATLTVISSLADELELVVVPEANNCGKGSAVRAGLARVTRDWVVIQDADLEYNPQEILKLLECAEKEDLSAVYGSRYLHAGRAVGGAWLNYWAVKLLACVQWLLYGRWLSDPHTCYKLVKADLLKNLGLRSNGFEFCAEVNSKLLSLGVEIRELPIAYVPRTVAEGKKIKPHDFFIAAWTYVRVRFWPTNNAAAKSGSALEQSTASSSTLWSWFYVVSRIGISGLLMFAGASKLGATDAVPLTDSIVIPASFVFAWGLFEFALGVLGVSLWPHRALNRVLILMFTGFSVLLMFQWFSGWESCQCLGSASMGIVWMLLLDFLIVAMLVLLNRQWDAPVWLGTSILGEQLGNLRVVLPLLLAGVVLWFGSLDAGVGYLSGETVLVDRVAKFGGRLTPGSMAEGEWRLKNVSRKTVRILGARNSCRCVVVEDLPLSIEPGTVQTIRFRVYGTVKSGVRKEAVELYFDDPSFRRRLEVVFVVRSDGAGSEQVVFDDKLID
jgi:dolichol-phosphate mannosyltransferase